MSPTQTITERRNLVAYGVSTANHDAVTSALGTPTFLLLPSEIRQAIYTLCLATPSQHAYNIHSLDYQLTPNLLLVNHQIYDEARLIPFQQNVFDFDKWNGTGLMFCQLFLRRLQPWQRMNVRSIRLNALAVSLTSKTMVERWLDICELLGRSERRDGGLHTLQLTISGCITKWKETFDVSAPWVACGLLKLRSLRSLELSMVVEPESAHLDLLTAFISNLQKGLYGTKIALKPITKGKSSTLSLPVSWEAFSIY